jgi:EmrB/QacA subfamily drug resistance transporter
MLGIGLINMLVALDQTIVSTALPSIVSEFGGLRDYAWIAGAYFQASIISVPVFGRLGDYFGRKRFVVAAVVVFTVASVLCAFAPGIGTLTAARALQGLGGGMMIGTAFASIPDLFPDPRQRVRWQVVMAAAYGIGTMAGPSAGGWLSGHYGWRWTFSVNVPVGVLALYFICRYLPVHRHAARAGKVSIDWSGTVWLSIVLGTLQLAIQRLSASGMSAHNLLLCAAVLLGFVGLLVCERRATHPIVPLDLFRDPQLVTLFTLSMLSGFLMFSLIFSTPLLLQGGFGMTPEWAGLLVTPIATCMAFGSVINTRIVTRLSRPAAILIFGFGLVALSSALFATAGPDTPPFALELAMAAVGFGLGFVLNNLNVFGQEIAGRERFGIVTALLQSTRMIGGVLGTSALAAIVNHCYSLGVADMLAQFGSRSAGWPPDLADSRVLVDPAFSAALRVKLDAAGFDGTALLDAARQTLIHAIHVGMSIAAAAAVCATLLVYRISHVVFQPKLHH